MGRFCGMCGSRLDEATGLCPQCDAEALARRQNTAAQSAAGQRTQQSSDAQQTDKRQGSAGRRAPGSSAARQGTEHQSAVHQNHAPSGTHKRRTPPRRSSAAADSRRLRTIIIAIAMAAVIAGIVAVAHVVKCGTLSPARSDAGTASDTSGAGSLFGAGGDADGETTDTVYTDVEPVSYDLAIENTVIEALITEDGMAYIPLVSDDGIVIDVGTSGYAAVTPDREHIVVYGGGFYLTDLNQTQKSRFETDYAGLQYMEHITNDGLLYVGDRFDDWHTYRILFADGEARECDYQTRDYSGSTASLIYVQDGEDSYHHKIINIMPQSDATSSIVKDYSDDRESAYRYGADVGISDDGGLYYMASELWPLEYVEDGVRTVLGEEEFEAGASVWTPRRSRDGNLFLYAMQGKGQDEESVYAARRGLLWVKRRGEEVLQLSLDGWIEIDNVNTDKGLLSDTYTEEVTGIYLTVSNYDLDEDYAIYYLSLDGTATRLVAETDDWYQIANGTLLYRDEDQDILVAHVNEGTMSEPVNLGETHQYYLTPDGAYLYYQAERSADTYCLKTSESEPLQMPAETYYTKAVGYSEDGATIYFLSDEDGRGTLTSWTYGDEALTTIAENVDMEYGITSAECIGSKDVINPNQFVYLQYQSDDTMNLMQWNGSSAVTLAENVHMTERRQQQ